MKQLRFYLFPGLIILAVAVMPACKAKKIVPPPPVAETFPPEPPSKPTPPQVATAPAPAPQATPAPQPAPPAPDYNFANIQFEFNSGILKTESYPIMDKAAAEMKKDPSVKFVLNGNASAEGTAQHNMALSVERANAVKAYLVNSGINAANLEAVGYGETKPIADNTTETGRVLNRRVEIKKAN